MSTLREYIVNGAIVLGLAVIVSLSWVGSPANTGWSRFIGSVVFYSFIELAVWFVAHPAVRQPRVLALVRSRARRNLPPE